ncbi:ATP phosphoribosyltransferase [Paenibacillus polymyxa]|uniref:ATP phosphoribosyltransferase n=1 Tax=Paenibacillus polymyxa TaxID=1406 RepID=UPI00307EDB45
MRQIRLAIPKGRLLNESLLILYYLGIEVENTPSDSRKLILNSKCGKYQIIYLKSNDIIELVQTGYIDAGIVGGDVLLEREPDIISVCNLDIGNCKLCLAGTNDLDFSEIKVVASKYPRLTKKYFESKKMNVSIYYLNGSIEAAPQIGVANAIVDLVQTGNTLKDNDLRVLEKISDISAVLVSNKIFFDQNVSYFGSLRNKMNFLRKIES